MAESDGWAFFDAAQRLRSTAVAPSAAHVHARPPVEEQARSFADDARAEVATALNFVVLSLDRDPVDLMHTRTDCSAPALARARRRKAFVALQSMRRDWERSCCPECKAQDCFRKVDGKRVCVRCGMSRVDLLEDDELACIGKGYESEDEVHRHQERRRPLSPTPGEELADTYQDPLHPTKRFRTAAARLESARAPSRVTYSQARTRDMRSFMQALAPELRSTLRVCEPTPVATAARSEPSGANGDTADSARRATAARGANAVQLLREVLRVQNIDDGQLPTIRGRVPHERRRRPIISGTPCYETNERVFRRALKHVTRSMPVAFANTVQLALTDVMAVYRRLGRIIRHTVLLPLLALWQSCLLTGHLVEPSLPFVRRWRGLLMLCEGSVLDALNEVLTAEAEARLVRRFWTRRREFLEVLTKPNPERSDGRWSVAWNDDPFLWVTRRAQCIVRDMLDGANGTPLVLPAGHVHLLRPFVGRLERYVADCLAFVARHAAHYTERRNRDLQARQRALQRVKRLPGERARRMLHGMSAAMRARLLPARFNTHFVLAMSLAPKSLADVDRLNALAVASVMHGCDRLGELVPELNALLVHDIRRELRQPSAHVLAVVSAARRSQTERVAEGFGLPKLTLNRALLTLWLCERVRRAQRVEPAYAL